MNIFKLVGEIVVNNEEAVEKIKDTTRKAEELSKKVGNSVQDAGKKLTSVGKALAPLSAAVGGVLTASVKGASDFQNGMAKMSTLFDTSKTSVSDLSKEFLNLSSKTGLGAKELAEAGYQALSAGQDVSKVGGFVETAGNLAKAGFTTTTTAVDILTTAINAYGEKAGNANQISNKLVRTQNLGKTTVDELSSSMGKIIPTASAMNVNIDNLTSGYVSLTKQGIATAEATTYMNSMFNELGDSGTTLGGVIKEKTGMSFQDCMKNGMSLADVLQITKQYADENGIAYNELWSSAEAGKAGLAILNGGVDEFNKTVETMASDTDDVGEALKKLETPSVKIQKSLNRLKNSGIELGTAFVTVLTPTIDKVSSTTERITARFNSLDDHTKTMIATAMSIVAVASPVLLIGGKIISFIGTAITTGGRLIGGIPKLIALIGGINPVIIGVIAVIAAIIAAGVALYKNWDTIKEKAGELKDAVAEKWNNLKERTAEIWNSIVSVVSTVWDTMKNVVTVGVMLIGEIISAAVQIITLPWMFIWENCKEYIIAAWEFIKNAVSTALNAISTAISVVWNAIVGFLSPILEGIKNTFSSIWNGIKSVVTSAINAISAVISSVLSAVQSFISSVLNGIKSVFSSVWNSIKTTVTSAINGVKSIISSGLNAAKSTVSSVLESIKSKFSSIFESAKNIVSSAINTIKGFFNFSWSLPPLKLPHFSISGSFSLKPPSVPHFSVEWYKKAMSDPYLFTKPTVFDVNPITGTARGAGEAGDEIMYGRSNLMNDISEVIDARNGTIVQVIDDWMERLFELFAEYFPTFSQPLVLDTGVLVAETAEQMDDELGIIRKRKERS